MKTKKNIIVASHAGFCFGVNRAIEMAQRNLKKNEKIYSLGSLIHNPQTVKLLEEQGLKVTKDQKEIPPQAVVLVRAHGIAKEVEEALIKKKTKIIDATCPFVKSAQRIAENLKEDRYQVIIFGDAQHAEVIGLKSYGGPKTIILEDVNQAKSLNFFGKIGLLSQTTQKFNQFNKVATELLKHTNELIIRNTICSDTATKQKEIKKIASMVEVMIIVGGKESSNTKKLFQLSLEKCAKSYHIETEQELKSEWFKEIKKIGVGAGASTPQTIIEAVTEKITELS